MKIVKVEKNPMGGYFSMVMLIMIKITILAQLFLMIVIFQFNGRISYNGKTLKSYLKKMNLKSVET